MHEVGGGGLDRRDNRTRFSDDETVSERINELIFWEAVAVLLLGQRQQGVLTLRQIDHVSTRCHVSGNFLGSLDPAQLDKTFASVDECLGQQLCCLGVSLGRNDGGLLDLLGLFDQEPGLLCLLLSHLLQLDGLSEFSSKGQVSDGNVVQDDSELAGSLGQLSVDSGRHKLSLSDQLAGIELSYDCLEDFVGDGGKDPVIVVSTQGGVDVGQSVRLWSEKDPQGDVDVLQVLGSGDGRDVLLGET